MMDSDEPSLSEAYPNDVVIHYIMRPTIWRYPFRCVAPIETLGIGC